MPVCVCVCDCVRGMCLCVCVTMWEMCVCTQVWCVRACAHAASLDFPTNSSPQSSDSFTHRDVKRLWFPLLNQRALFRAVLCVLCRVWILQQTASNARFLTFFTKQRGFWYCIILSVWKYLPRSRSFLAFQNNLEGSVDGVYISLLQSVTSPPWAFPPILLSPSPPYFFPLHPLWELNHVASFFGHSWAFPFFHHLEEA